MTDPPKTLADFLYWQQLDLNPKEAEELAKKILNFLYAKK